MSVYEFHLHFALLYYRILRCLQCTFLWQVSCLYRLYPRPSRLSELSMTSYNTVCDCVTSALNKDSDFTVPSTQTKAQGLATKVVAAVQQVARRHLMPLKVHC